MDPQDPCLQLLAVEDSEVDHELLLIALEDQGVRCDARRVESESQLATALREQPWDLVVSDHHLPGFSGARALEMVRALELPPPIIIVSGVLGEEAAVEAMRLGADDYLVKGRLARLGLAVRNAVDAACARRARAEAELQLRNLSGRLQAMMDEQRRAIARDIHDDVGGALTALRFDLDAIARHLPEARLPRLDRARATLQAAFEAAQRIMRDLRPPELDAGLASAIEWQVERFGARTGLATRFSTVAAPHVVADPLAMAAYRTCQEALTNVSKHAHATCVEVELRGDGGTLELAVRDDGHGIAPSALGKPDSLGLRGLAERARAAGGSLQVGSSGRGTAVVLRLPLPRALETA